MLFNDIRSRTHRDYLRSRHHRRSSWDSYIWECNPFVGYRSYWDDENYALQLQLKSLAAQQTWRYRLPMWPPSLY